MIKKKNSVNSSSKLLSNVSLEGSLVFEEGEVLINAHYKGDIESKKGTLLLGAQAKVNGNINVQRLVIYGTWSGKCRADYVELKKDCNVISDNVHSKNLLVEEGAKFEGNFEVDTEIENTTKP